MNESKNDQWTPALVLEHVKVMLQEADRRYQERFEAQEKAIITAHASGERVIAVTERNAEKWRESANEWRDAMDDREHKFATKEEIAIQFAALRERLNKLELIREHMTGAAEGLSVGWKLLIGAAGFVVTVMTVLNVVVYVKGPELGVRNMQQAPVTRSQ